MKISPTYSNNHWNDLNLTQSYSDEWIEGANIVYDRIHGRYLAQIETLEQHLNVDIWLYSGFLIIGIDCMVIETLNQFYLGISDTNQVYDGRNRESFRDFFLGSQFFNNDFDEDISFLFYDHVRNGLLHQAQTKGKTLININESEMIIKANPNDLSEGIILNRELFHEALVNEFKAYIKKLKTDNSAHDDLRGKCIDKMATIC
ncbi:MAG: hypothetical protein H8D45_10305 [Bacteroidetes bacterium]|nr:hypothetical protein [Bacteroidota bacterium]MBL7105185.1 hypothetical protein [Bacteroidales bacterium]